MAYQKCPVCGGSGVCYDNFATSSSAVCPTCKGSRIIDEVTGLAPYEVKVVTTTTTSDFELKLGKDGILRDQNGGEVQSSYTVN